MTNLEDLIWLYKMALEYNLQDEKHWLKIQIEERLSEIKSHKQEILELNKKLTDESQLEPFINGFFSQAS